MLGIRQNIGGLGNLMFKNAYLWAQMRDGAIPDIYVQDEKYFKKYSEEIKQMYGANIFPKSIDKVALHIRRGDYLKATQFHTPLWQTDYYVRAVTMFPEDTQFLVFCKDNQDPKLDAADHLWCVEYAKEVLKLRGRFEMRQHQSETDDLNTMASCDSLIMANSSFSWWAAYLGGHHRVICPKEWFTDGVQRIGLLDKWEKI